MAAGVIADGTGVRVDLGRARDPGADAEKIVLNCRDPVGEQDDPVPLRSLFWSLPLPF
jgi:hypothetical protein